MKNRTTSKVIRFLQQAQVKFINIREDWLNRATERFTEDYYVAYKKKPEAFEIKRFRKTVVMKFVLVGYFLILIVGLFIWMSLRNGGDSV